ncbi:MAG: RluA family pseudouridine synthase [Lachnospiraceae bacterium]|nr:RluA family pseudouridine synthase [Lachnospiraceae bacterium]
MKEFIITENDEGRRMDKYVMNILRGAGPSFTYKMLRKKNIVLNDGRAGGKELLKSGDSIKIYLSDETFEKFSEKNDTGIAADHPMPPIVYEDDDMMIVNKPAGMLTQKAGAKDVSLNEICLSYIKAQDPEAYRNSQFTPSVCNRLDRNTSGLVTFAKTYRAARCLSEGFSDKTLHKIYKCIAVGVIKEDMDLTGVLVKDAATNTVTISDKGDGAYIETIVHPITNNGKLTIAEVSPLTGRTHQIRAHMAYAHFPLLGDNKYGDTSVNDIYRKKYGIKSQILVCTAISFPDGFEIAAVAGKTFEIAFPEEYMQVM